MADTNPPPNSPDAPITPAPRRRKRWPLILLGIVIVLILLVLLIPTIASTGLVRSIVVSKINDNLTGKVDIKDWSLGWFSGIDVRDVTVFDSQNQEVLSVGHVHTDLTLLNAIKGNYDLGNTLIEEPNLVKFTIGEDGQSNYQKLSKPSTGTKSSSEKSSELPNVRGNISIKSLRGAIVTYVQGKPQTLFIQPSTVDLKIPDINSPIEEKLNLITKVNDGPEGTIAASGTVTAINSNKILPVGKITADQTITLTSIDLGALSPFIKMSGTDLSLTGMTNGSLAIKSQGTDGSLNGSINIVNLSATGTPLKGDTLKTAKLDIPVQLAVANGILTITSLKVDSDLVKVDVNGTIPQSILTNLQNQKAPGAAGNLKATLLVDDVPKLINQLPHVVNLQQGVTLTSGKMSATSEIAIAKDSIAAKNHIELTNVAGTNNSRPVKLSDITADASGKEIATGDAGGKMNFADVRDLTVVVASSFIQLNGGGQSVNNIKVDGKFDLAKAREELAQFADLSNTQMSGTGTLTAATHEDPTSNAPIATHAQIDVSSVKLTLPGRPALDEPHASVIIDGSYDGATGAIGSAKLNVATGDAAAPTLAINATVAKITTNPLTAQQFELTQLSIPDLAKAQKAYGAFMPVLQAQGIIIHSGQLTATASGSYDGKTLTIVKPFVATLANVTFDKPAQATVAGSEPASGKLDGQLTLNRAGTDTKVSGTLNLTSLTVAPYITNEQATVALDATAPDTTDDVKATAKISSSFANVDVTDANVALKNSGLAMLKSAAVTVSSPDLSKTYSLINTFKPASTQPAPAATTPAAPLQVRSGTLNLAMNIAAKDASNATITISDMKIDKLAIQRGAGNYAFAQPLTMKLAAALVFDAKGAMSSAQVSQLDGKFGLADIAMSTPIKITKTGAGHSLDGAITVNGQIQNITGLLEALDAKTPGSVYPYQGAYAMTQAFTSDPASGNTTLKGSITATDFKVLQNGKASFTEQKLAIANDCLFNFSSADSTKNVVNINSVTVDMQSSGALKLSAKGVLSDPDKSRTIDPAHPLAVDLDYDLAKLQPIIKPMIAADPKSAIADLTMSGKHHESYQVTGSYPQGAFNESAKHLKATGAIAAQSITTNGLKIENFNVPVSLDGGVLTVLAINTGTPATPAPSAAQSSTPTPSTTKPSKSASPSAKSASPSAPSAKSASTKPASTQPNPTATVNGGTLDITGAKIDLTALTPRLTLPANLKLITSVQINPVLAAKIAKDNPLISPQSSGVLNITVVNCQKLPAGALINVVSDPTTKEVNDGTATFQVSATGLGLGGTLFDKIAMILPNLQQAGSVDLQPSNYTFAKGELTQKSLLANQYLGTITLSGGIRLSDLAYDNFTINLPSKLYGNYAALGAMISIPVGGTVTSPKIDTNVLANSFKNMKPKDALSAAEQILSGQGSQPAPTTTSSTTKGSNAKQQQQQPTIQDTAQDLVNLFGKKKDKKKSQ